MATAHPISSPEPTDCLLVCPFQLFGDMLADLLSATSFRIVRRVTSIAEARRLYGSAIAPEPFVILAFCCHDPDEHDFVKWLSQRYPDTSALILAGRFDSAYLTACVTAGVDGLLHADMSAEGFVHSLELLRAGEKVFPSRLAKEMRAGDFSLGRSDTAPGQPATDGALNKRDAGIVRMVARGEPNKAIARAFDLSEATVKMHLRQIFTKLKVQNRTQAATWACANGFAATDHNSAIA